MATYIHGTDLSEQARLAALNRLTNTDFLDFLNPGPADRILEIGSGLGMLAADLARRCPHAHVTGLEYSPDQLARAPRDVPNLEFRQGDAHVLPYADRSFDLIYCRYLLEHVADPLRVLREAHRVLRPGGRIAAQENDISLVRHDPPTPAFDAVWHAFGTLQAQLGGDAYIGRRLFSLFRQAGFEQPRLSPAPEIFWAGHSRFAPWLENLAGNVRSGQPALVERGLASASQIDAALAELRALILNPEGSTWFYWNRASAQR